MIRVRLDNFEFSILTTSTMQEYKFDIDCTPQTTKHQNMEQRYQEVFGTEGSAKRKREDYAIQLRKAKR